MINDMNSKIQTLSGNKQHMSRHSAVLDRVSIDSFQEVAADLSPSPSFESESPMKMPLTVTSKIQFRPDSKLKGIREISFMKKFIELRKVNIVEGIFSKT